MILRLLSEVTPGGQIKLGAPSRLRLEDAIYRRLVKEYEKSARRIHGELGGDGKFKLQAAWKQRELQQKAKAMARAVEKTTRARLEKIATYPPGQRGERRKEFLQYKATQLEDLIAAEAQFGAQVDLLAHSGLVNVSKARVMNFTTVGTDPGHSPCTICMEIAAGNPYTIQQATTLGAKAHPGCIDHWEENWQADEAFRQNTRRQVADGEVTLWGGTARTPARGRASDRQAKMQTAKGGWKGRRTQQKRMNTRRKAA